MKTSFLEDNLNFKLIIQKCIQKWYYFAVGLIIALGIALIYLKTTTKLYEVKATVKLNDPKTKPQVDSETVAFASLGGSSEIDDEIGMLSSFFMVDKAIGQLDFNTTYYHDNHFLGITDSEEFYKKIKVHFDLSTLQPIGVPVYLSLIDENRVRVRVEAEEVYLYDILGESVSEEPIKALEIEKEISVNDTLRSPHLSFWLDESSLEHMEVGEDYFFMLHSKNNVVKKYYERLSIIKLTEDSNIIEVSTNGSVIEKEEDFINTLINAYIDFDLATKNQHGVRTIRFIDNQLSVVSDSLKDAESTLQDYRTSNNLVDIGIQSERLAKRLSELEVQEEKLRIQYEYYKNMAQYLGQDPNFDNVVAPASVGIDDPLLSSLIIELSNLNREKVSIGYSSNDNNPVLKVINRKIQNARESLKENVDNQIKSTQLGLTEVRRNIQSVERQLNRLPQNERNLVDIQRKFTLNDNIYNYLLQKKAEAGIAIASSVSDKMMVDEARVVDDSPVYPNPVKVLFLAFFAGVFFPLGLILVKDMFNENINSLDDIQRVAEVPVLETVRLEKKHSKKPSLSKDPVVNESFKFSRLHLNRLYGEGTGQIIGITSSIEGEGKTFCTAHLGASFALSGRRTIIISGDLHRPKLNGYFNAHQTPGISDYITDKASFHEVVQQTSVGHLDIISAGSSHFTDPSSLLESKKFQDLLVKLKSTYQYIIVDTPPIGYVADYLFMEPLFDINLLVARQGVTTTPILRTTVEMLLKRKVSNLHVIYNGVSSVADNDYGYRKNIISYHKV
ncbi:capsular exopolysaccharide synthesis family protein [Catalinimonas alkaloidigena]|uniref:GumC family protein n=1 Tax=Catalinimonas alkaloidigena TaxID=1075417 RepID=UPI00240591C7|nr:tyrosine-protein kinase family protein [Catalinimonas alkaloidigena]MDF9799674.1 capsular exopolysaccharide synthesis family protein [Catalinimonas alkaloidigena]